MGTFPRSEGSRAHLVRVLAVNLFATFTTMFTRRTRCGGKPPLAASLHFWRVESKSPLEGEGWALEVWPFLAGLRRLRLRLRLHPSIILALAPPAMRGVIERW